MEKLLAATFASSQELYIIDDQGVYMSVAITKLVKRTALDSLNKVVRKCFTREIEDFAMTSFANPVADGL